MFFSNVSGSNTQVLAFPGGPGGFREPREAGRNHFHLSWYLIVPGVTSYGQNPWGDFWPSTVQLPLSDVNTWDQQPFIGAKIELNVQPLTLCPENLRLSPFALHPKFAEGGHTRGLCIWSWAHVQLGGKESVLLRSISAPMNHTDGWLCLDAKSNIKLHLPPPTPHPAVWSAAKNQEHSIGMPTMYWEPDCNTNLVSLAFDMWRNCFCHCLSSSESGQKGFTRSLPIRCKTSSKTVKKHSQQLRQA